MSEKVIDLVSRIKNYELPVLEENVNTVSYSQFHMFSTCPLQWYLSYVLKLAPYDPSIHTLFGTSMHETIQEWLNEMYSNTIASSMRLDLNKMLEENLKSNFKIEKSRNNNLNFSSPEELKEFYNDGVSILDFIKRKRSDYFDKKHTHLLGCEIPLLYKIKENVFFKGFIDLVFYDEVFDEYKIVDIKTSTRGWFNSAKKDENKIAQLVLYKEFFSRQFDIDINKINVEYFILKRKLPDYSDYTVKHVQLFKPASGKIKRKRVLERLDNFISTVFDTNGNYNLVELNPNPSKKNCRFCPFLDKKDVCKVGISN